MKIKSKYLWYTDLHLGKVLPWTFFNFIRHIHREKPKGIFLTGDISTGPLLSFHLNLMARLIKCPIYFVLGNHDYYFTNIEKQHEKLRKLCAKYSNLVWLTESDIISLNEDSALIGAEGWYDAHRGSPKLLKITIDWILTEDFRKLPSMAERIEAFRCLADNSVEQIERKLEKALSQGYKKIYILTHFPPWQEATRNERKIFKSYHLSYDANLRLGKMIERVMRKSKASVTVLSGHTHLDCWLHVSNNIECKVNEAKYYGFIRNEEQIFI
jgi:3',5'-cyclic-AMP phosphodiesterase